MLIRKFGFLILLLATLSACEEIINVDDISDERVSILAPAEGTTVSDGDVSFNWETIAGADNYRLEIATPNFATASQVVVDSLVSKDRFVRTLEAGEYEWRLKAVNSAYETVYSSANFTVLTDISEKNVALLSPENDATVAAGIIAFEWEAVTGAQTYTFQIATPDFSSATNIVEDIQTNELTASKELEAGSYIWRVKAVNDLGETRFTEYNLTVE